MINRRIFLWLLVVSLFVGCRPLAVEPVAAAERATRKPKALLIMLDGWRADTLENAHLPNIERLRKGTWQPDYNGAWSATALRHFGIDPVAAQLDGRAIETVAAPSPARPLAEGLAVYLPFSDNALVNVVKDGPKPVALGPRAVSGGRDGIFGGCLHLGGDKVASGGVRLDGSEKLVFSNGVEFAATMWVRLPETQTGDSVIFANKDWRDGNNPGIVLTSFRKGDGAIKPGVCFNAKIDGKPSRIDLGTYHFEPGKWEFYAVTRDGEGTLSFYQGSFDGRFYRICGRAEKLILQALPFCLGQDGTGNYGHLLDGEIDDFALWTRTLTPCEVKRIYEAGRKGLELAVILQD